MVCSPETAPILQLGNEPAEHCGSLVLRRGEAMDAADKKAAPMRAAFLNGCGGPQPPRPTFVDGRHLRVVAVARPNLELRDFSAYYPWLAQVPLESKKSAVSRSCIMAPVRPTSVCFERL